jgi:hypothetical protein
MGWIANLFGKMPEAPPTQTVIEATREALTWLEPQENPFGIRVLDCRPMAEHWISTTKDPEAIRFLFSTESLSGTQFCGQRPENSSQFECELVYPLSTTLPDGAVFLAGEMEDKWNVYHFAGVVYFVRSWNGKLRYTATLARSKSELRVVELAACVDDPFCNESITVSAVDFLIRSHVLRQVAPHPVPPLPTTEQIAIWSFAEYGRRGLYAAVAS